MMLLAVSGCLLGHKVRFDRGHKRDEFVMDKLSTYAEFVSFCPEDLAFGSPRASLRLVDDSSKKKVISNKTLEDLSEKLVGASETELNRISQDGLGGIILKSKSPSCGLMSAKIYLDNGFVSKKDDGVFAAMCRERFPLLPIEEEGRLNDSWLRENFVMQLFMYDAFENFKKVATMGKLVEFHRISKFLLQSKDENIYRYLGRLVGNNFKKDFVEILSEYEYHFKTAISKKSSIGRTVNVLEHMAGFLKNYLSKEEKYLLHEQIDDCHKKIIPVIVPLSTLKIYATKYRVDYLLEQIYIDPYPKELALRSSIESLK